MGYDYDRAGQLIEAVSTNRIAANADYDYDPAGNPIRRTVMGVSVTNAFNSLNQQIYTDWTGMTLSVAGSVNYNAGTVVVEGVTAERYGDTFTAQGVSLSPGTNEIEAVYYGPMFTNAGHIATDTVTVVVSDREMTYDPAGNLTNDGVYVYAYDTANRLTNVTDLSSGSNLLSCTYDGLGRRKAVTRDGTNTERYVYVPGTWLVLAVLDGNGSVKELYTHGPDLSGTVGGAGGIGGILAVQGVNNAETYALHADTMGNIVLATDTNGHEAATYRYTPFGRLTTATGEFKSRYLFSSKEYDDEVGLYYYGYRYYQPDRGRWLTRDPIGERGGQNLYLFVNNNPQWFVDPLGLQAEDPCCINGEHVDCEILRERYSSLIRNSRGALRDLAGVGEMFERADVHNKTSAAIFSANLFLGGVGAFKSMAARNAAPAMTSAAKGTLRVGIFTEGGHVAVAGSTPFSTAVQGYNTARNIGALSSSSQKLGPVTAGTLGVKFGSTAKRILDPYGRLSDVENELGLKMSRETYALLGSLQELANEVQELIVQCCD